MAVCQLAFMSVAKCHTQNDQAPLWGFRTPGDGVIWRIGDVIVRSLHSAQRTILCLQAVTSSNNREADSAGHCGRAGSLQSQCVI